MTKTQFVEIKLTEESSVLIEKLERLSSRVDGTIKIAERLYGVDMEPDNAPMSDEKKMYTALADLDIMLHREKSYLVEEYTALIHDRVSDFYMGEFLVRLVKKQVGDSAYDFIVNVVLGVIRSRMISTSALLSEMMKLDLEWTIRYRALKERYQIDELERGT